MPQSFDVIFASSNKNKFHEAKKILYSCGIRLGFFQCMLEEIQDNSLKKIATHKVIQAYTICKKPVIVEDSGLFIESLGGFPGSYSSYVFKTIGNNGILRLVRKNRTAKFMSIIAFYDKRRTPLTFEATIIGKISKNSRGKGWGYDPIFIPKGKNKTYGQLENKNEFSHRYHSLKKFSKWFNNQKSSGQ